MIWEDFIKEERIGHLYGSCSMDMCKPYVKEIRKWCTKGTLFLSGEPGCGKTYLALSILRYFVDRGVWCRCTTVNRYMDICFNEKNGTQVFGECTLLLLDDLYIKTQSTAIESMLFELMEHRYSRALPTIITSNFELKKLALSDRIKSRLKPITEIAISEPDMRGLIQLKCDSTPNLSFR